MKTSDGVENPLTVLIKENERLVAEVAEHVAHNALQAQALQAATKEIERLKAELLEGAK